MKYNAFNLNISTDTDIPFLRHGHIQDAEAEIYVFRHSIPYYEQVQIFIRSKCHCRFAGMGMTGKQIGKAVPHNCGSV